MPVIAIGAAIASVAVAASGVAAVGLTVATGFEIAAAVGATLAAVGTVTKDKTLTMVGGAIGAIGAIGGLASAAGVFGSTSGSSLFGPSTAASTADTAGSVGADTGATFADSLTPATTGTAAGAVESGTWDAAATATAAADAASSNTIPFVADGLPPGQNDIMTFSDVADKATNPATNLANATDPTVAAGATAPTSAIDPATGLPSTDTSTSASGLINQSSSGSTDLIDTPPTPPNNLGTVDPNTGQTVTSAVDPATGKIVSLPDSGSKGIFGDILDFAKKNPTLVSGALTVGGKLLEGMTSTLTPAQVDALQAQAAANNAAAALANQQRTNLAMPKSVASSQPVTGTASPIVPPHGAMGQPGGVGVINQPQLAPVTGKPA